MGPCSARQAAFPKHQPGGPRAGGRHASSCPSQPHLHSFTSHTGPGHDSPRQSGPRRDGRCAAQRHQGVEGTTGGSRAHLPTTRGGQVGSRRAVNPGVRAYNALRSCAPRWCRRHSTATQHSSTTKQQSSTGYPVRVRWVQQQGEPEAGEGWGGENPLAGMVHSLLGLGAGWPRNTPWARRRDASTQGSGTEARRHKPCRRSSEPCNTRRPRAATPSGSTTSPLQTATLARWPTKGRKGCRPPRPQSRSEASPLPTSHPITKGVSELGCTSQAA
jgi:hypothetical protein